MKSTLESFAPTAALFRRLHLLSIVSGVSFMLICWLGTLPIDVRSYPIVKSLPEKFAPALWFIAFVSMIACKVVLKCSECEQSLNSATGCYCPECGKSTLSDINCGSPRSCFNCGTTLHYRKGGRMFKVRYCNGCGAHLDERGV